MDYYRSRRKRFGKSVNIFLLSKLTRLAFFGLIGLIVLVVVLFFWYGRDLPTPGKLTAGNFSKSTRIFDRNGVVLYDIFENQNRAYIPLDEIPKNLQEATIAIEDKDFYKNQGFSISGYFRAARDFILFRRVTGASTLTQQLVKNTLLTSERTIPRKIKEFMLAIQVDRKYKKEQILELYLNAAPYGGSMVGVEVASENYFGKKAKDLDLVESAILAGMPQLPSYYSPYGSHPKAYMDRTKQVLRRMREDGYITKKEEEDAIKALPYVDFLEQTASIKAPHFSFYVKDQLVKQFGEDYVENGGLQVTTTLDYKLQEQAEKIVKEEVANALSLNVENGASVVIDPKTGEILSMVGSKDFFADETEISETEAVPFEGQFNVITQGLRQPGSTIKPVTYATALSKGYTAATLLMDTKTVFPNQGGEDYIPKNYDGKFNGPLQLRSALGSSINIPAVKLLALVGLKDVLTTANNMGLTTLAPTEDNIKRFGLSLTLGGGEVKPLDLASAYTAFANGGYKTDPVSILKVTDYKGKVLYENKNVSKKKVLNPEVAFIISDMLLDNKARLLTFGENSYLNVNGRPIAVKTGTTDDKKDNWTIGWTPSILVLTWVGNNDNTAMGNVASGVTGAAPIWRRILLEALKERPNEDFARPDNVVPLTIDAYGGGAPVDGRPTRLEYFIKGTEPQGAGTIYQDVKVSKADTNKLASQSEIDKGEYDTRKFIVFSEKDPVSTDGQNRWQQGIDEWVNEKYKDDPLYHKPTETSTREITDSPTPTVTPSYTPTPTP
ncbi:MAG: PBP1A family penicillin-binding protein [Patescibacteria group bacterium]|nr:PBP1A family penicillin-binding protein [Patescibacteria group bacterium]